MTTVLESIRDWLTDQEVSFREVHHEPTRTSEDSARVRGEELRNGGKALVMKLDDDFALFVLPADRRAHSGTIRRTLGVRKLRFATAEELAEFVSVMKKLMRVRDVILAVNREYIRSAAMSDDYRTEPAFKLQGSYRNMNRIAEKVVPIMNDDELQSLIVSNYENDSQTLTSDTEANLLKFKELIGALTEDELGRWDAIKKTFQQHVKMRGVGAADLCPERRHQDDDAMSRVRIDGRARE